MTEIEDIVFAKFVSTEVNSGQPVRLFELEYGGKIQTQTRAGQHAWVLQPQAGGFIGLHFTGPGYVPSDVLETLIRLWGAKFGVEIADKIDIVRR